MGADGSNQTKLTSTGTSNSPTWSPDGSKIAFAGFRDGNGDVYIMNADGTGQTRLTTDVEGDGNPAWAP
jgi:TolB protein